MSSAQRLAELNLNTMREAFETTANGAQEMSRTKNFQDMQAQVFQPLLERTQTYSQRVFEIMAETQREAVEAMTRMLQQGRSPFLVPGDWNAMFETFNSGVRRLSSMTAENLAATADAGEDAATAARQYARKTA